MVSAMLCSSSMIKTIFCIGLILVCRFFAFFAATFARQPDGEHRTFAHPTAHANAALVLLHEFLCYPQSKTRPDCLFSGEKGLENSFQLFRIDAASGIRNRQTHHPMWALD